MGSLSNYGENAWMGHLCGTAYTSVSTVYLALATGDPGEAATGASMNEVANSNNYSRTALTFAAAWSRRITQNADCSFPTASGAWGTVTHYAITDSGTHGAGNVLAYGAFTTSFAPVFLSAPKVNSGQCYIEISTSSGEGFTTQFCNWMLEKMFRNTTYAQPATYIALLDTVGADSDTTLTTAGKEISGTSYARVLLNKSGGSSPAWEAVSGGASQNAAAVAFPTVGSGGWAGIVGIAIVDGGTLDAGNVLAYDNDQVVDQTANAGSTVQLATGALDISLT